MNHRLYVYIKKYTHKRNVYNNKIKRRFSRQFSNPPGRSFPRQSMACELNGRFTNISLRRHIIYIIIRKKNPGPKRRVHKTVCKSSTAKYNKRPLTRPRRCIYIVVFRDPFNRSIYTRTLSLTLFSTVVYFWKNFAASYI